jgi:hypothetical protein
MGHAKALLSFTNIKDRRRMSSLAIRNKWSVRELERRATARHTAPTPPGPEPSVHLRDLERRLGDHLGTRVAIHAGAGKGRGRISLEFYSHEQFQGLLRRMQFDPSAGGSTRALPERGPRCNIAGPPATGSPRKFTLMGNLMS